MRYMRPHTRMCAYAHVRTRARSHVCEGWHTPEIVSIVSISRLSYVYQTVRGGQRVDKCGAIVDACPLSGDECIHGAD